MFSTANTIGDSDNIIDLVVGSAVVNAPGDSWIFAGKSDEAPYAFTFADTGNQGTLTLAQPPGPLTGNFVLSLKAGKQYSVYAFGGGKNITSFQFMNLPSGLSHATLYTGSGITFQDPMATPEPASLAIWGVGICGLAISRRRRKKA